VVLALILTLAGSLSGSFQGIGALCAGGKKFTMLTLQWRARIISIYFQLFRKQRH
jgi:hypothetical protein